jgi:hypothetical protein
MGIDYLSLKDADLDNWFKYMNQYVAGKCTGAQAEWTHIPQEARTKMADDFILWHDAYVKTIGPHTPVDTEAKNGAKKAVKTDIRLFVNQYLRFLPVTDEDRTAMKIPNRDPTRSPIGKPKTKPAFNVEVKGARSLVLPFRDEGSASRAIPYGMSGAVISWGFFETPPANQKQLANTALATASPHVLEFEEEDRGKRVYIAMQWQNERGQRGNYTDIPSAIVP